LKKKKPSLSETQLKRVTLFTCVYFEAIGHPVARFYKESFLKFRPKWDGKRQIASDRVCGRHVAVTLHPKTEYKGNRGHKKGWAV
jgi:hypothetical protein